MEPKSYKGAFLASRCIDLLEGNEYLEFKNDYWSF